MQIRIGIAALALAALVGCGTQTASPPASTSAPQPPAAVPAAEATPSEGEVSTDTANTTLVTLKLPGMS